MAKFVVGVSGGESGTGAAEDASGKIKEIGAAAK
jgi:hypothetical protein